MEKLILSKSTFLRGLQCPKSLFLYKNNFQQRDAASTTQQAIFSRGNAVGVLAQSLFPGGTDASSSDRFKFTEATAKTQALINSGASIIYEAAFQYEGVYVALDILVKENGSWMAYEVKSSAKITAAYLMDAALQYYVITQSGLPLNDFQLIYMNTGYVKSKQLELEKMFQRKSVTKEILQRQKNVSEKIQELKAGLESYVLPEISIGEHCHTPYNCDFLGTCRGVVQDDSIFYLNGISKQKQYEFYHAGIKKIKELPADYAFTNDQKIQYECSISNKTFINREAIAGFMKGINYPLYFLDFEMFMPAVPLYEATSPYEHIPFLYSLHYKENINQELKHLFFLAETGEHPIKNFIAQLIIDMGKVGDILIFDPTQEIKVLNKAIQLFPEWKTDLVKIIGRIKDLSLPFEKKYFYMQQMKGSYSMKLLLPAIAPELDFENLKIKNGISALAAFENLQTESDLFKALEVRESLIEYCKMDTLGLVKIFEALESLAVSNT